MGQSEDVLAIADRHVREFEVRVARQIALVEQMDRDKQLREAAMAREVLVVFQQTLELARAHRSIECEIYGRRREGAQRSRALASDPPDQGSPG